MAFFFVIIFLSLPFLNASLMPVKSCPSWKYLGHRDSWANSVPELHSLGLLAGLSEEAGSTLLAQTLILCGQFL